MHIYTFELRREFNRYLSYEISLINDLTMRRVMKQCSMLRKAGSPGVENHGIV